MNGTDSLRQHAGPIYRNIDEDTKYIVLFIGVGENLALGADTRARSADSAIIFKRVFRLDTRVCELDTRYSILDRSAHSVCSYP